MNAKMKKKDLTFLSKNVDWDKKLRAYIIVAFECTEYAFCLSAPLLLAVCVCVFFLPVFFESIEAEKSDRGYAVAKEKKSNDKSE